MSTPAETPNPEQRIAQLREEIAYHNELYYRNAAPEISDFEYDLLKAELAALEEAHPEFAAENSPTQTVGDDRSDAFAKYTHRVPMQSLDNTYEEKGFERFWEKIEKEEPGLSTEEIEMLVEPKIDGLSVSYTYENGKFVRAATRGNGVEGDDISRHVPNIAGVPAALRPIPGKTFPRLIEIRGEIYMKNAEFRRINAQREHDGLEPFANPRNLAAGTIKSQNPAETRNRRLDTFVYGIGACEPDNAFSSLSELRETLHAWGFPLTDYCGKVVGWNAALEEIRKFGELRKSLDYPTDGAVVKIDSFALQGILGENSAAPRWSVAFKYAPEEAETTLLCITLQLGRTGVITPVAELEPVMISGTRVSRAMLNNEAFIEKLDLRVGDRVIVTKGGEIIPKIIRVVPEKRPVWAEPYSFEKALKSLGIEAVREEKIRPVSKKDPTRGMKKTVVWTVKDKSMPEVRALRLAYFASKHCMNIPLFSKGIATKLIESGLVNNPADIYSLTPLALEMRAGIKGKTQTALLSGIEKSRSRELWRLINAIGIPGVGVEEAKKLEQRFGSLDNLRTATDVPEDIHNFFLDPENIEFCDALVAAGVNTTAAGPANVSSEKVFEGKVFAFTGALSMKRDDAKEIVTRNGGKVLPSVSKKIDTLVVGKDAGSKLEKARTLGIEIIDEAEFLRRAGISAENSAAEAGVPADLDVPAETPARTETPAENDELF